MKAPAQSRGRGIRLAAALFVVVGMGGASGCLTRPIEPIEPQITSTVVERLKQSAVDKIDLLFVVDNSPSMADKQAILALAVPDLIGRLVNPQCLVSTGGAMDGTPLPTSQQPKGPLVNCPKGSKREFPAVLDIHVGMITSSLGSFGANGCPEPDPIGTFCKANISDNDHGHLVTRVDPCTGGTVATYQDEGFLAWDPGQTLKPPGLDAVGDPTATPPDPGLATSLHDLVLGAGQYGCGFESQNEAWYRFLVDPSPYGVPPNGGIELDATGHVQTSGTDDVLLQQRREFMRPDSLLAIIVLSDETDTSIKELGQYPLFAETVDTSTNPPSEFHLPLPRQECQTKGPADPCCASCGAPTPAGCSPDPTCTVNGKVAQYTDKTENISIRAFGLSTGKMSHKARYGIEFFYPPSRYVTALTSDTVTDAAGVTVPNPLFSPDPSSKDPTVRDHGLVFYAAITGVPWQLIARQDPNGTPDLNGGVYVDPLTKAKSTPGGFKSYEELARKDKFGNTFWDDIVGDPENYVPPLSPFMQESTLPRTGTDPITGIAMSPPGAGAGPNPINGHEWNTAGIPQTLEPPPAYLPPSGDTEYACIFPLLGDPIDCTTAPTCDCNYPAAADNPLCDPDPTTGKPTLQARAKAYPGVKNLAIAKGMKSQGIAASICPAQLATPNNPDGTPAKDYGYRPAVDAIIDRLKVALTAECLPRALTPDPKTHQVTCVVLEATDPMGQACDCKSAARAPVDKLYTAAQQAAEEQIVELGLTQDSCFCQITQAKGAALDACQAQTADPPIDASGKEVDGWCYVDATAVPPIGNAALVEGCPDTERRLIRFAGKSQPAKNALTFITCEGQ